MPKLKPLEEIINIPLRSVGGRISYFNSNGVIEVSELSSDKRVSSKDVVDTALDTIFEGNVVVDVMAYKSAAAKLNPGSTYEDFVKLLEKAQSKSNSIRSTQSKGKVVNPLPTGLDRFITGYESPATYFKEDGSKEIDSIVIYVGYLRYYDGDKTKYIKDNIQEIIKKTKTHLLKNDRYKTHNLTQDKLKCTRVRNFTKQDTLELTFRLNEG